VGGGLQLRLYDVVTAGVEVGGRTGGAEGQSGTYVRAQASHWAREPMPAGLSSDGFLWITHSSEWIYDARERNFTACGYVSGALPVIDVGPGLAVGPALEVRLSTDTAGQPWNRYAEYGLVIEASSSAGSIPLFASAGVLYRSSFHPLGLDGGFLRVVVGARRSF
jgi:hypothetical protein